MQRNTIHSSAVSLRHIAVQFLLFFTVLNTWSQEPDYLPKGIDKHPIIKHSHFTLSYNEAEKQADWVAYELTKAEVDMKGDRCNCFAEDDKVKQNGATLEDYQGSGFDRGHLAPAADFYQDTNANRETFLMSNMSPQSPGLNRGLWADLEAWVRTKASEFGKIYVVTGPVFQNSWGTIGKGQVRIPGYFYKVILFKDKDGVYRSIGFIIPNIGASGQLRDYKVPVNLVESITGLDFFHQIDSGLQEKCESQFDEKIWGL